MSDRATDLIKYIFEDAQIHARTTADLFAISQELARLGIFTELMDMGAGIHYLILDKDRNNHVVEQKGE